MALDLKNSHVDIKEKFVIDSKTVNPYNNSFDLLVKDLTRYKKNGYRVILLSGSRTRAKRLAEDLMARCVQETGPLMLMPPIPMKWMCSGWLKLILYIY